MPRPEARRVLPIIFTREVGAVRYRKLSDTFDFTFGHGQDNYYRDRPEAPGQAVLTRLRLMIPEWFLDNTEGTPYNTKVMGKYTMDTWERAVKARIRETENVLSLDDFQATYDNQTRRATFKAAITTVYGETTIDIPDFDLLPLYGD